MIESDIIFDNTKQLDKSPTVTSFYLINAGYAKISGILHSKTIPKNPDETYLLFYIHKGDMTIDDGEKKSVLSAGDIYIMSPENKYVHTVEKRQYNEHYYFFLGGVSVKQILCDLSLPCSTPLHVGVQEKIFEIYKTIKCNFGFNKFRYTAINFKYILDLLTQASVITNKIVLKDESPVAPAIAYIKENSMHPISLEKLAEICFVSKFYFIRIFKKHTGNTPLQYITTERVVQAKYLLTTTETSVSQISEMIGFNDAFHFSNVFYKKTGYRPHQYRKLFKNSN